MKILEKRSQLWIYAAVLMSILLFFSIVGSRILLEQQLLLRQILAFLCIALIPGLFALLGYFGARFFSLLAIIGNVLGCGYMLFIVFMTKDGGWADLTSFAGYFVIFGFFTVIGLVVETIYFGIKRLRRFGRKRK
ncbi:MAG: hypothetical protein QY314_01585 [Candidatus Dojkabacteria bacterium]|nr:MAG: hypothetical protein QY314_01585 [Candidatus Dojkabacteria bacterium]